MHNGIRLLAAGKSTVLAVACSLAAAQSAYATESGTSHYFPGGYNDFFMNRQVEPGFHFRDDLIYYSAAVDQGTTLGNHVTIDADLELWATAFKLTYVSHFEVLGGRYAADLVMPVVFDAHIRAGVDLRPLLFIESQANQGGISDMVAVPLSLTWQWGDVSVNLREAVFMPTGYYRVDDIVNLSRNHWSFDTMAGLTWLHPARGHEISFNVGFISNTKNAATQYQSGDEFHMDYTVARHFSEAFAAGVTGYYYHQLTNDESPLLGQLNSAINTVNPIRTALGQSALPAVNGYRGEAAGIGPIVRYSPRFGDKQVHFIGKWLHEFDVKNRFKGDIGMLSVSLDF